LAEREVMLGLEPAVVGAAELCKGFEFDHGRLPCGLIFRWGLDMRFRVVHK
jgi:hypothetical protein